MLVGNNIALVIYGFFMGDLLMDWLQGMLPLSNIYINNIIENFGLMIQTIISTIVILMTAEFFPKIFFKIYSNALLKFFAFPAYFFYMLFYFVTSFVIWLSDVVLQKFFKTGADQVQFSFSKMELGNYISEQMEDVGEEQEIDSEIQIFQNALEFAEVKAREVMVPRTEIIAIDFHENIKKVQQIFIETGLSKLLVYRNTIDNIVGHVHSFDLFKYPKKLSTILLPIELVPETMLIKDVLDVLTKRRKSIAVVLDEYGGTSGMITVEDIVEELFGEIEDEHDSVNLVEKKISKNVYCFSARQEVDYINETYKLNLPEAEQYETLGGLVIFNTEEIPKQNEIIEIADFEFTILEVSNTKIELIELKKLPVEK